MAERPLYTLYKNLKAQNYDVPDDYNKFESALTRDGKGGADNRHAIYENLKAQNFDVPSTYERFYSALFEPRSKTSSRAKGGSVPMSAADRARFSAGAAAISASAQKTMNNAGRYNRMKQRKQKQQKDFGRVNLGTHQTPFGGDANNVMKDDFAYNHETGKAGAYVTSDNENVYSLTEAEQSQAHDVAYQNAVDTGEIPSVFDVRDKKGNYDLQENIGKNGTYLTEEGARKQFDKKLADAYARKKEIEAAIAEDHRLHGNPLLSYGASIGASNGRTAEQSDYSNKLATSLALVKQQIGALEAVKQYPTSSWGEDALKALDNTVFTAKTWDFGLTDFATMGQMERIKTKMDNNIPLSGSDKMLLKSKLGADAAAALEDEKMGNIYRWTKIAGQSLPFMADFFLTGGYGGITKGISRGALKFAAKRGMGKVSAAILKNTGIVAGDVIGSYAMAGTEQALKTGADIMQRHLGNLYQDEKGDYKFGTFDENGNLLHEGGESMGTALYKGLTSAMVENYTEKLFGHNYGIKKGAVNFMEKHGMNASAEFFKNIGKSGWYTNSKKWMEKFGINGFAEEVMEEEIAIPLHALLDGEGKVSDLLDAKQQLDIIGGMAISVGSMYAMGAGSRPVKGIYNRAQYYRFRNKVNVADSDAQNLMGDNWADIKDKIDNATNEQMGGVLADILRQRDTMSKDQINAAINYGINLMKMRGYNVAKTAEMNAREITNEPTTPEEQHQEDIDNAYSEGHDADDADKHDIQLEHEDQMKTLAGLLNISEQQLSAMNDDELQSLTGQNEKLDQAIYDYQLSSARYQGVTDDAQDKIDMAANQAAQRVDMYTDKSRGSVRNATVKASGGAEDYGVYIISGNIATNEDGSINVADSDDMILFYDPTTNSVEHADALRFAELGDEVPADDVKAQAVADAKEKAIKEVAGIVDGTIDVGSQFKVTGADGTEHTYEVLADYGDGTAAISIDGTVVENPYSLADLQQMKDLEDQKRLEAAKAEREQMEKERAAQQNQEAEETQPSFDFNQILNDNGNVVLADVLGNDGNTKYPNSQLFLIRDSGAKAKVVELKSDGTLVPHAVNKKDVRTATTMTLDEYKQAFADSSMIEDNSGENRGEIEVEAPTIEGETAAPADGVAAPESAETAATEQTPAATAISLEDGTIVPMLEDGNPDFSKLTAAQTAELYDSQFGDDAESVISSWVSDAKKALDKASNMTVKGKTFVEQKASKDAKEKAIADAQAAYDYAIAIRDAYNSRQLAKVEDTAEGRKELIEKARRKFSRLKSAVKDDAEAVSQLYKDVVGSLLHRLYDVTGIDATDTIPLTAEEYVASNLGAHSLNYEGTETSKGVKQETGLSREDFAKTQLLAADGKGTTIDDLVHSLWENRPSNLESLDTQDIRNALIGVLNSGFKASEARNYIENLRIAQAENILEEQKRAQENAAYAEQQKAEQEAELKAKSDEKAESEAKSEEKTHSESFNKIVDLAKKLEEILDNPDNVKEIDKITHEIDELMETLSDEEFKEVSDVLLNIDEDLEYLTADEYERREGVEESKKAKAYNESLQQAIKRIAPYADALKATVKSGDKKAIAKAQKELTDALLASNLGHGYLSRQLEYAKSAKKKDESYSERRALVKPLTDAINAIESELDSALAEAGLEGVHVDFTEGGHGWIYADKGSAWSSRLKALDNDYRNVSQYETQNPISVLPQVTIDNVEKVAGIIKSRIEEGERYNSDEYNDEDEQTKFPDKLKEGSETIEVPEDATEENPLGAQRDESDLPFSAKENGKQQTTAERAADVEKNKVDDMKVVDNIVGEKTRNAFERLAKMMGANIQWQYSDKLGNGWIQETKDADGNVHRTIFITLDSSITEGAQFIFGHEMTHQIKNLNPAAYNELTQLVLDTYGSDAFDKAVDETMKRYSDAGFSGRARDYYAEEVVADSVGEMIRDLNLAHTLAMKMSHPLLAAIHEILQKIKLAFFGTEYSDVTKNIIRSIEQAYVKTANGQVTNSETGEDVSFSLRQKPEPKKKGVGYKVFVLKDGKLYPPMVANPDGAATPVGVWLDADAAPISGESKTGRPQVKQGGKGTQGGSGKLAYRPGWHLGVVPYAIQFNRKDAEGNKTLFPKNFVFAEVEYAADVDYQEEARQEGINPSGKYQHSLAGLKHLPTDGYYMYRTNPNPETDPWVITGAMKVNRILTRAEQAELVKKAGREPQQIQEGDIVTDDVVNSINQEIAAAPKFSLKVYHGSGADFTEFDFDHMGEGAGSQVFGWGGYVTSSKKIGKDYAAVGQQSAESRHAYSEDTPIEAAVSAILGQDMYNNQAKTFEQKKAQAIKNAENSIASFSDMLKNSNELDEKGKKFLQKSIENDKKKLEVLRTLTEEQYKEEYIKQGRAKNLYEVDIPDDNGSNYLEWYGDVPSNLDKEKLAELILDKTGAKEKVARFKATPAYLKALEFDIKNRINEAKTGQRLYINISSFVSEKDASEILSSLGYTGIKYPAGTIMGGAEENDTNYVIFKPEDMKITQHTKFSIKTYHGSQASFDKFDHSFMGSGEGDQAYGWGTYVSEVEGIAKAYAKSNATIHSDNGYKEALYKYREADFNYHITETSYKNAVKNLKEKEQLAHPKIKNLEKELEEAKSSGDTISVGFLETALKNWNEVLQTARKEVSKYEDTILPNDKDALEKAKKRMEELMPERNLYYVDIPDDTGRNYIGWDEPLGATKIVRLPKVFKANGWEYEKREMYGRRTDVYTKYANGKELEGQITVEPSTTGGELYKQLASDLGVGSDKAASEFLSKAGFVGVKVIAQRNTGGNKEGKMNYVIFDENNAQITNHTKFSLRLKSAIEETETNPSDAQKESGNYKKGHIKFGGYDYTIENPKGSTRSGKDADGKEWKVTMHDTYGYIRGKFGKDGDHLDMFINDKADLDNWNGDVFVVDQVNPDGSFDEHKVMYGYDSMDDAKKAYLANYSDGWQGLGNITGVSKDEFDKWLDTSKRKLKPFADYTKVKLSLKDEKIKSVAEKFGVNEDDVAMYANAVERGSTADAARARANIKRYLLQANEDKISSLKDIIKYTKPINEALKENFGDLDAMIEERRKQVEAERNAMEAARKRAQEEEEKRQKHLSELSLIPTDELDKRYMDAIANNDESTAREMLDESARRNGYGDVGSDYQGQGAWAAPSNPQYESDEARRADIENSPDVNLEDIALGYSLQPDDYFDNPRAYMNNTAYGLESAHVIKNALDAIKNGEKDVKVKVYRAVPTSVKEGKLRNGDWVTPSKKYAEMHGDNRLEGKYRIIEDEVPANQLWWDGNDANEFGFDDGREYRYKNAKNNRKLNDLITYDNNGNVIPPSKRFNSRKNDIRFSLKAEKEKIVTDAKANGIYMTAPNGEKTKLNAEQWATVRTTNFKNWFGDWENDPDNASKVVDENGEPMVVWHGRSAEFNTFEKKEGVRFIMGLEDKVKAEGFFFSPDKGLAEEFASNSSRHRGGKANVVPCFLNIRRPMDLTGEDYDRIYEDVTGWEYMVGMDTQDNLWGIMDEEGMADKIKEKGYDGAIFVEEVDDSYEPTKISYCALDSNQIKSAENNNGDFSADNNDIRFSLKSMMAKPDGWKQANKKAIHIAEAIERDPKFSIRTYHGTGASFDKFDLSHALEGEGSETFGHGVYVTNSKEIGGEYAKRGKENKISEWLSNDKNIPNKYRNNENVLDDYKHIAREIAYGKSLNDLKAEAERSYKVETDNIKQKINVWEHGEENPRSYEIYFYQNDLEDTPENREKYRKETIDGYKEDLQLYDNMIKAVRGMKEEDFSNVPRGFRYDVDIPDDNGSNYLDWEGTIPDSLDKQKVAEDAYKVVSDNQGFNDFKATPLNDFIAHTLKTYVDTTDVAASVEKLKSDIKDVIEDDLADDDVLALNEYLKDATTDDVLATIWYNDLVRDIDNAETGEELYRKLSTYVGDNAASEILADNGFVGIKYPAGMIHGGAKEGDYNYVIFDENNANIVGNTRFSLRYDQFEHDLNQWKKDNNLPKDAQRPTIPQRNAGESAVDFLRRVDEYRKQMALWKTAPTYEQHLLSDDTALGEFNRELQRGSVLKRIAFQDSMLAIRKAQEAIMKEVGVDRLNMAEDAYTAENRSHGKGKNEFEEYNNEFLQPLRKAYHQMKKVLGDSYDNVRVYMMAKHGLERDAQMAFKKSLEADYEDVNQRSAAYKAYKNDLDRVSNDADLEFGRVDFTTWRQKDNALRGKYSPSYMDYRYDDNGIAYDYSGLSSLFDGSDFEEAAHRLVRNVETKHLAEVQALWNATNAATKKILRDGFKAGMMSKDTYQYVRDMYSHYIPLRGWDGTTADQVWDYVGGGKGAFNQTLKTAHGRTSIADDPIAYIENMAESGILLNNKNWVKQHLMLLAQNHPTSLLTLSKAWYVKSMDANGNEEWIPATPQITSQMNSNQVKAAIDAFDKKMEQMAQTGDATQKRDGLNITYPQTHSEEREHEVRVMKDGEEYVIYVNGDPQLAQAMNNTRAHRVSEGIKNSISKRVIAVVGRKMAAAYTSLSPLFIPSNYFRDLTMTLASTAIREDAKYNYLLRKNLTTSWNLGFMLKDFQNGKLRDKVNNGNATPKEQMFYDFMMNGGETGFVSSLDVEDLKKKFKNDLKDLDRWKANPVKVGHTIMDSIEFLNRAIEDSNRFAVYMTSIQYGRSIDEAVNDAKNVTLNFNRKGTGEHSWQTIRNLYLFINPAVQSLQTLGALAKHHPFKFTAVTASWIASGVLVPIVNAALMQMTAAFLGGDGDDDKDWYKDISKKYWQFSKWDRRNNFIMWVPTTHEFVKIPLAQEFRAFYGVGDMIASKMMGGELAEESWSQYAEDLLGQVVDMLPLDPTGYDGELGVSLMPNPIRPVFELAFNVDFTGKPLFKDTEYNKYDPNFTKAYVGTPDWLVRASRMMNSIGNDYPDVQQNKWDALGNPRYNLNNPAVVDHVLSSYLGGAYTMGSQVLGLLTKSLNDPKEIKVADIPLFSKFVSNPDDRPVTKKQGDEFWNMKENHDRAANTLSKLKKQAKVDGDYSMLERFYGSEEYKQYKQDDVKVKKYEEDKKKERAEESGEEYRPHKLNAEDIYKAHATPKDDFEDLKLKQLYTKLNGFKTSYDLLVDTAPGQSDAYYNTNKVAIDAIDEISLDKQEISELKKGFLDDGKDAYNAEDMKQIRELRKKILAVLERANKVVVANQKAKTEK